MSGRNYSPLIFGLISHAAALVVVSSNADHPLLSRSSRDVRFRGVKRTLFQKLLTRDEARRIAAIVARLAELLREA
jgi:hypothetical protein